MFKEKWLYFPALLQSSPSYDDLTTDQKLLYQDFRIPDERLVQMRAFNQAALTNQYAAEIRALAIGYGYADPGKLAISDADSLVNLETEANRLSASLQSGFNRYLQAAISNGLDRSGVEQWRDQAVGKYNAEELWPREAQVIDNQAHLDFLANNATGALVQFLPEDAVCDYCIAAVEAGPVSPEEADSFDGVGHMGCDHGPEDVDPGTMPSDGADLWLG